MQFDDAKPIMKPAGLVAPMQAARILGVSPTQMSLLLKAGVVTVEQSASRVLIPAVDLASLTGGYARLALQNLEEEL